MSNRVAARRYLRWLRRKHPRAFNDRRQPLQRGIQRKLLEDARRPTWATERVVQAALALWTHHPAYTLNIIDRKPRIDLRGRHVAQVVFWEFLRTRRSVVLKGKESELQSIAAKELRRQGAAV